MKKKDLNSEVKANVVSGMSSAAGSAAGVVIGSMTANEVEAAEEVVATESDNSETESVATETVASSTATTGHANTTASHANTGGSQEVAVVVDDEEETDDIDVNVITTEPGDNPLVEVDHPAEPHEERHGVTGVQTMTLDNGQQVDVAAIEVDGQMVAIADMDRDGVADIAFSDLNGNGEIEENEIADISEQGVDMQQFQTEGDTDSNLIAQANDVDYTNDANVDMYYV